MRRVGKGFFGVETPLFAGMLVEQQVAEEGITEVHGEEVNAGDTAKGDVTVAYGEVPTANEEPSIPSPTPPTLPPQPSHDIPSTSQVQPTPPQSPQGRMIAEMDQDANVVLEDDKEVADEAKEVAEDVDVVLEDDKEVANEAKEVAKDAKEDKAKPAKVQEVVDVVTTAKIITKVVIAAIETITAASTNITASEAQVPAVTLTTDPARVAAAPSRRRKGVVIRDPEEESTTSTIIPAKTKSKDKGKAELNKNIDWDEAIDYVKKKAKADPTVKRYQGMSYDDIRPIFERYFNSNMAFLQKTKEHIEEEESRALKRLNETPAEKAAKRRKLDEDVEELKRHL
nr:hypothetical protein [Tanacetum cinerariifolium]